MYGYQEHIEISPDQLLQKVSQQQIFEWILEEPFGFHLRYISPFRDDENPGCRFEMRDDGIILFIDFGERFLSGHTHRSCFKMVMDRFNISLIGAIRRICEHFQLPIDKANYNEVAHVEGLTYQKRDAPAGADINYVPKEYLRPDKLYWSQYIITVPELLSDNVFSCAKFMVKTDKKYSVVVPYSHCYVMDFVDKKKIYQPYRKEYKWISSCDENCIGNIDNLPASGDELIIQKSYKDHRVLRNLELELNVIWFQNEGCVPSLEILANLISRFRLITIFYDNDEQGILAAMKLYEILNELKPDCCRIVHLPNFISRKLTWKDPSEFINKEGREDTIKVVKHILY